MPDLHTYCLFLAAGLLLNLTPGADMLYVTTHSVRHGLGHGLTAALGIFTGTLFHIGFAVAGLSALLATSATAFSIVKWLGAAYLVYLGLSMLLARGNSPADAQTAAPTPTRTKRAAWRGGALVNLLNPKVALFFVAFLPQFVDSAAPHHVWALILLGLSFNVTGTLVNMLAALTVVGVARRPAARRLGALVQRVVGVAFIGLGARLAMVHQR